MNLNGIRGELLKATRRACSQDKMFAATSGSLPIFDRETGRAVITPSGCPCEDMTEDGMVAMGGTQAYTPALTSGPVRVVESAGARRFPGKD